MNTMNTMKIEDHMSATAPIPSYQRAQYTINGVEYPPSYVVVVGGEWFTPQAIKARKEMGLDVTPD